MTALFEVLATDARWFDDIRFYATIKVFSHWVEFTVYDVLSLAPPALFQRCGGFGHNPTESLEEAEVYLHGEVKWDGCSNWHFDQQDRVMLHGCSREDVVRFGEVMARCWDYTKENLETWGGS